MLAITFQSVWTPAERLANAVTAKMPMFEKSPTSMTNDTCPAAISYRFSFISLTSIFLPFGMGIAGKQLFQSHPEIP
jgi:hypothetical protein